jgi:amino acid adenylation domain-containing protein
VDSGASKFDLSLFLVEQDDGLRGTLEYSTELFEPATAARIVGHFQTLLDAATRAPHAHIRELPILTDAEHQQLLQYTHTRGAYTQHHLLHTLFEQQAQHTPLAEAVRFQDSALSYQQLDQRATRLAATLQRLGVRPDTPVAVAMERSLELVVALLGILKAGGAYVPLDPDYPTDRLAFMLHDAEPAVLLTQSHLSDRLPEHQRPVLCLDHGWDTDDDNALEEPALVPDHLAYVIYTSGSTGRPKGAQNSHHAICNRLLWMQDAYHLTTDDTVLQKTPYSFDVSVWEFFWPLLAGARLLLARPGGHKDPGYLADLIQEQRVTVCHFVPSMLEAFLTEPGLDRRCASLRDVVCSGEALSYDLQERFFGRLGARLHNLYGPTEAAVDVTYWDCRRGDQRRLVPIGRPIANIQMHVLDDHGNPTPVGVPGELFIGGVGLARGYHNRPQLTAEKFITHQRLGRLYRTGDLGRWLPDGALDYLGRLDHQVKLRGFRVELGEIEAVLCEQPAVRAAVVAAREDTPGDKRLVAYVVPDTDVSAEALRTHLRARLPEYMVPSAFVLLDALPLSPNGKVDRKVLPAPESAGASTAYVAPRDAVEEAVAGVWSEVLGVEQVGVHDSFFDLGGHSLLATQVLSRLRQLFSVDVPLRRLFEDPTGATLASAIREAQGGPMNGHIDGVNPNAGDDILSELDGLSEEEVDSMLREALASEEL